MGYFGNLWNKITGNDADEEQEKTSDVVKASNFYQNLKSGNMWQNQASEYQDKVAKMSGTEVKEYNPFLDKNGNIFNKYMDHQKVLDNPSVSQSAKNYIQKATGLTPTVIPSMSGSVGNNVGQNLFNFNANADENNLASLDVATELPKLSSTQISKIISQHFPNSTVIKPSDADGIYQAQQQSGMSALAILGIGALESGYGTSNIAKQKNNIWGWNATNVNPSGNAKSFSQMSQGAAEFANAFMKTYYNGYGAKSISSAGTGNNPSGKGYAYHDNGTINPQWATSVGSIMKNFYQTAKTVAPVQMVGNNISSTGNSIANKAQAYMGTPYVWGGSNVSHGGMDCSGFVYNALKDAGYNISRTTAQGYRNYGTTVSKSSMQPGDLVFFGKNNNASHIGIYLGNGKMIHSSGGSSNTKANPGKGVCVTDVNYRSDFLEARRYS